MYLIFMHSYDTIQTTNVGGGRIGYQYTEIRSMSCGIIDL